jgi:transcriptional regulator with XRE-family HTH domain
VDLAADISEFLTSRRAKVTPAQAGLPSYRPRRVAGLRREEVASLAGVSVEYYKRLERGNLAGASDAVLEALARTLQLDEAERAHLFDLARAISSEAPRRPRPTQPRVRLVVLRILEQMAMPATVSDVLGDLVAGNPLGRALYSPVLDSPQQPANTARFTFLDPAAIEFFPDWDRVAGDVVARLRSEAGRNPYDQGLSNLVGELATRSDEFRARWAAHNVRFHRSGTKRFRHPVVGKLELSYEALPLVGDNGLTLNVFTADADSASQHALDLLASWAANDDPARTRDRLLTLEEQVRR